MAAAAGRNGVRDMGFDPLAYAFGAKGSGYPAGRDLVSYLMGKNAAGGAYHEFTGSIIRFLASKAAPIRSIIASIAPVQDLHGYDNPWPAGGGKNLFNYENTGITFTNMGQSGSVFSNTNTDSRTFFNFQFRALNNRTVVVTSNAQSISSTGRKSATITISEPITHVLIVHNGSQRNLSVTYPFTGQGTFTISFNVTAYNPSSVGGLSFKDVQLEAGSTATSYAPYSNICPISGWTAANVYDEAEYDESATPKLTIPFTVGGDTKTIYGGTVSVDEDGKVKLTADKAYLYVDGSVSVYSMTYSSSAGVYGVIVKNPISGINTTISEPHLLCSRLNAKNGVHVGNTYVTGEGKVLVAILPDQTITTKEQATAWFSANPTQFVYDLAEPVEYDLADVTVLSTLVGTNVMWADTGDITVTARGTEIPEPELNAQQSLNLLLGGRYVNNHTEDEPSDEEALQIILGGNNR